MSREDRFSGRGMGARSRNLEGLRWVPFRRRGGGMLNFVRLRIRGGFGMVRCCLREMGGGRTLDRGRCENGCGEGGSLSFRRMGVFICLMCWVSKASGASILGLLDCTMLRYRLGGVGDGPSRSGCRRTMEEGFREVFPVRGCFQVREDFIYLCSPGLVFFCGEGVCWTIQFCLFSRRCFL